ncbi:hypothetical protein TRFO_08608 [Tritrichomonas foetus]|uniref:glucan endo-1,3-beta-D-glucosidase n=1 Tax=Tritrichomonas foetus TaxID=1144522 RepID=A0A1J4JIM7_9EUKA|nr:hypothetical protein TRFO_08608 [Tritrichomonas foetus]|eukprot:OHS99048.1 hypothetical protein TRFO_08608 [Tritrichomonas foetus]
MFAFLISSVICDCFFEDGNWYCNQVEQVEYQNIGTSGTYQRVTYMDGNSGQCNKEGHSYNGNFAPLNEEFSYHFRGPLNLKKFAVYYPDGNKYNRKTYYNAETKQADNIVFTNAMGGTAGSGVWSPNFGNSISFAASDGKAGAGSPQTLNDVTLPSTSEFHIWSGEKCEGNDCGYYLPGIPAYHGFKGSRVVLMQFKMPHDYSGNDMPAIWSLNAQIPRTQQYGDCSCWSTGCGEYDLFEVVTNNQEKMISHIHTAQGGNPPNKVPGGGAGNQDYFIRPTNNYMTGAVIYYEDGSKTTIIDVTSKNLNFGDSYSMSDVEGWRSSKGSVAYGMNSNSDNLNSNYDLNSDNTSMKCDFCRKLSQQLIEAFEDGLSEQQIIDQFTNACSYTGNMKSQCESFVTLYLPKFIEQLKTSIAKISAGRLCTFIHLCERKRV